jgi:hypothetical protein
MEKILGAGAILLVVYLGIYPWVKSLLIRRPRVFSRFIYLGYKKEADGGGTWSFRIDLYNSGDSAAQISKIVLSNENTPQIDLETLPTGLKLAVNRGTGLNGTITKVLAGSESNFPEDFKLSYTVEYTDEKGKPFSTKTSISGDMMVTNELL